MDRHCVQVAERGTLRLIGRSRISAEAWLACRLRQFAQCETYPVVFSDRVEPRLWRAIATQTRGTIVLTKPTYENIVFMGGHLGALDSGLRLIQALDGVGDLERYGGRGVEPIVDADFLGLDTPALVLRLKRVGAARIDGRRCKSGARSAASIDGASKSA